ncbi:MAG: hypothetical protein M3495_01710 [Pseudomonadota bacterium]|nr:hypothetical protein [Pseudomonadota bacterium]
MSTIVWIALNLIINIAPTKRRSIIITALIAAKIAVRNLASRTIVKRNLAIVAVNATTNISAAIRIVAVK